MHLIETGIAGVQVAALRSDTLPPATHTNYVVVAGDVVYIVDPGSPDPDENARLVRALEDTLAPGKPVAGLVLTHRHRDHVAGAVILQKILGAPILAHAVTARELAGKVPVDRTLADGDTLDLGGGRSLQVLHTPGHAWGHICLYEALGRTLIAGDMVAGVGSILIGEPDGDVREYLASLRRLSQLPLAHLIAAHGPPSHTPHALLEAYIAHRLAREAQVLEAVRETRGDLDAIVAVAYRDTSSVMRPWARRAAGAHLSKLIADGRVRASGPQDAPVFSICEDVAG